MYNRYFEDMKPGDRFVTMGKTLSEAEILDFAFRYDPQPFIWMPPTLRPAPMAG